MSLSPLKSINPISGELIKSYEPMSAGEIQQTLQAAHTAFNNWRHCSFAERASLLKEVAKQLREQQESLALLAAKEMGKPLKAGRAEVEKCAWCCEFFADQAEKFLAPETVLTDASKSYVTFEPLGVVLAVMPWNFPFWQVFRFAAPTLMAGNTALLKHSSNVSGCALAIAALWQQAAESLKLPADLFRTLLVANSEVAKIIESPVVAAVTLTGSGQAGRAVAMKAASMLKKTVLELGGSDPYIILADADLSKAAEICVASRLHNSGQTCIAAKRFIVETAVLEPFTQLMLEKMQLIQMGDPLLAETAIGPMARHDLRDQLHQQVIASIRKGAKCILGGKIPKSPGAYYPPTILTQVRKGMPAFDEELFGPVAAIISAANADEAIQLANESIYGLGGAIFTTDLQKGENLARTALAAGCCFVNAAVKSDPRLPFGGIKESGYGRELSPFGIREFVNIKTVFIN